MIIDIHAHVWDRDWLPAWYWKALCFTLGQFGITPKQAEEEMLPLIWDPTGEKVIAEMDKAGVDKVMVLCLDWGMADHGGPPQEAAKSIEEINRLHCELVQRYPDRLLYGIGVDPRRPNALSVLDTGVRDYGAKVLKLYPAAGFYPADRVVFPLYERCLEYGIPVEFHTGPMSALRNKYVHPMFFDDVAAEFPDLKIICSHAGHGWWQDMVAVARVRRNMYVDVSGWQPVSHNLRRLYQYVREMMDLLPGRVMWGSDRIGVPSMLVPWLKMWTSPPAELEQSGVSFSQSELGDFLGGTAANLLGIG